MKKFGLGLAYVVLLPVAVVLIYLGAALIGGIVPHGKSHSRPPVLTSHKVFLVSGLLHSDIAIPITPQTKTDFAFLQDHGFPLDHPELQYLLIGWGSREFYTSTKDYVDIGLSTTWTAITGDTSVMHVQPIGALYEGGNLKAFSLSGESLDQLVDFVVTSFKTNAGKPIVIKDATFGQGDLFFEGVGNFNIIRPCNIWTARALRVAGFNTGYWTPTTYSLQIGHWLYN